MTAPGLDNRLRQHSRRAGLMVGLSMALTIAVCIGSFVWIYAKFDPLTRDFVDVETPAPTREVAFSDTTGSEDENSVNSNNNVGTVNEDEPEPTNTPRPTPTSEAFNPTHIVTAVSAVNMRPGPAVSSGDPVTIVASGQELQYLDETQPSEDANADPGQNWLRFRTEDGVEGWVLEDFVEPINVGP